MIIGAVMIALVLRSTDFSFSTLMGDGTEEHIRHDLALEKLQRDRDE